MVNREVVLGLSLMLATASAVAAGLLYRHLYREPELTLDGDHCPLKPAATWLAVFDETDLWAAPQQDHMTQGVLSLAETMRKHDRLLVHVISGRPEDSATPAPLPGFPRGFRLCKSADPQRVNAVIENEVFARAAYERQFLEPLKSVLPALTAGASAPRTDILEALEILMWSPYLQPDIPERTLALFSDFLNHTPELSQLGGPLADPCQVLAYPLGERLKARPWQGVRVILYYLRNPRDAHRQTPEHFRFWVRLFYLLGAMEVFDGASLVANDTPACATDTPAVASKRLSATVTPSR